MFHFFALLVLFALLSNTAGAVQQYDYRLIDRKPQDRDTFVQGLEIVDGQLYVSSGEYGKSRLRRLDFATGELDVEHAMDPRLFAEGITILGDRVYQLTWRERLLLIYDKDELAAVQGWRIPGQGWGLTNNGEQLIYGDGSERLYFVSPSEGRISHAIQVTEAGRPVRQLNELEWIDGRIWANIWQTDRIVIIDPATGDVEGSVNLEGLLPTLERQPGTDVLNGIARDPADGGIWVTGKNWPWLYRIELVPIPAVAPETTTEKSR